MSFSTLGGVVASEHYYDYKHQAFPWLYGPF